MKIPRRHSLTRAMTTGVLIFALVGCEQIAAERPAETPRTVAVALVASASTPAPTQAPEAAWTLSGTATWYRWHAGEAAAGPLLRRALGLHWRGQSVTVCARSCVRVTLTDWCLCRDRRLVDLDSRSFVKLAPLSVGIVRVTIAIGGNAPIPIAPATDTREEP